MIICNLWTPYPCTKILSAKLFELLRMRKLILSSLNTAATLRAHIFTRFPLFKLNIKEKCFFLPLTYTYTCNEPSQMNIFKYFCFLDWYMAHLCLLKAALSIATTLTLTFLPVFLCKWVCKCLGFKPSFHTKDRVKNVT